MRTRSAASTKYRQLTAVRVLPKEGTRLRAAYDLLLANPGKPVTPPDRRDLERLRDQYGLEFKRYFDDAANRFDGRIVLIGFWHGGSYQSFTQDRPSS